MKTTTNSVYHKTNKFPTEYVNKWNCENGFSSLVVPAASIWNIYKDSRQSGVGRNSSVLFAGLQTGTCLLPLTETEECWQKQTNKKMHKMRKTMDLDRKVRKRWAVFFKLPSKKRNKIIITNQTSVDVEVRNKIKNHTCLYFLNINFWLAKCRYHQVCRNEQKAHYNLEM